MKTDNSPLKLTATQRQVFEALCEKQTEKHPLGDWYLGAIFALQNKHNPDRFSQAAHSMRELLEKLPEAIRKDEEQASHPYPFKSQRQQIHTSLVRDQRRYPDGWKGKKIDKKLNNTLQQVVGFFTATQGPTRGERTQSAIKKFDPMAFVYDPVIQKEKSDRFIEIWKEFEKFVHHGSSPEDKPFYESFADAEQMIFDLLAPITAHDQQAIRALLENPEPTEDDASSMFALLERRGANYVFFFKHVQDAAWIPILKKQGFFDSPPGGAPDSEGILWFQLWQPLLFLQRVANTVPDQVVEILIDLPQTENPRTSHRICMIASEIEDIESSLKLKPWVVKYFKSSYGLLDRRPIIDLLNRWGGESDSSVAAALELLKIAVRFRPDPESEEKQALRRENLELVAFGKTSLNPLPHFTEWDYYFILKDGVQPMAENAPYQVARILNDASASLIRLSNHRDNPGEISWVRLDRPVQSIPDSKAMLIYTFAFACQKVYEISPESVKELDQVLRDRTWKLFMRLRQHLYTQNPSEQTLPWIRECILEHADYAGVSYDYEFQLMISRACEYFGESLLNEEERTQIFDAIRNGPLFATYAFVTGRTGAPATEEGFQRWQRVSHRKKLRPFAKLLTGKFLNYYQELETEFEDIPLTDEEYLPFRVGQGGLVSNHSPISPEDLAELPNEKLLALVNKWQDEHEDRENGLFRINIEGLAGAFQTVIKDAITSDEERLKFWIENRDLIERPVYVNAIIKAIQDHVSEQNYEWLERWFEFCKWVLLRPDSESEDGVQQHENSRDYPDWRSSRWAVRNFIGACLGRVVNVPICARQSLAQLLGLLCNQFDWRLDGDEPPVPNGDDQIAEAISNTRSRALQDLMDFGFWVRGHDPDNDVPEVASILEKRVSPDANYPLKMPEHALLGWQYVKVYALDQAWAAKHKEVLFPQNDLPLWIAAFGSFLQGDQASGQLYAVLKEDFMFALDHLVELKAINPSGEELPDKLGQHLFYYYYEWDFYPLSGQDSPLEKFYKKTTEDRKRWAGLFDHVGWTLVRRNEPLEEDLRDRVVAFFDWRIKVEEPEELKEFTSWLEAECLKPDWRLDAFSKVLDVCRSKDRSISFMSDALDGMLESHTAKVVKCYAEMTETNDQLAYFPKDQARSIWEAGRNSEDENVRKDAVRARDNLLNRGDYDLLDFEE